MGEVRLTMEKQFGIAFEPDSSHFAAYINGTSQPIFGCLAQTGVNKSLMVSVQCDGRNSGNTVRIVYDGNDPTFVYGDGSAVAAFDVSGIVP